MLFPILHDQPVMTDLIEQVESSRAVGRVDPGAAIGQGQELQQLLDAAIREKRGRERLGNNFLCRRFLQGMRAENKEGSWSGATLRLERMAGFVICAFKE